MVAPPKPKELKPLVLLLIPAFVLMVAVMRLLPINAATHGMPIAIWVPMNRGPIKKILIAQLRFSSLTLPWCTTPGEGFFKITSGENSRLFSLDFQLY